MPTSTYAPSAFRALNGIFCIYKPPGSTMKNIRRTIPMKLAADLNLLPDRPLRRMVKLEEQNLGTDLPIVTAVPDLADHPQVIGPRYLPEDIYFKYELHLNRLSSGLVVCGIGREAQKLRYIKHSEMMRVYHVQGHLGMATQDFSPTGHLVEKTTWGHVKQGQLDRVVSGIQASHQKNMFHQAGVDLQSQEAYEMAVKGIVRPKDEDIPIIYGIKCIEFEPPYFTLEIHSIGERCKYFMEVVHEIGLMLKSSAVCTKLQRIRIGHFTLEHALLQRHWNCEGIISNIAFCRPLIRKEFLDSGLHMRKIEASEHLTLQNGAEKYLDQIAEPEESVEGIGEESHQGIY
ncbi:pseudouridylate synthase TRUB2, mitochondrial-like isoform X2 [Lineus longissimus]